MDNLKETQQAAIQLTKLINGFQVSQIIHVAAELGIADRLGNGARPSSDMAAEIGAHPRSLYRLMHALASAGVGLLHGPRWHLEPAWRRRRSLLA
jgi:hypothetical protein